MIDDEIDFSNTRSNLLYTPEGHMYLYILYQALEDYRKTRPKQPMKIRALEFLMSDSDVLKLTCWLLGIELYKVNAIVYDKELFTLFKRKIKYLTLSVERYLDNLEEENEDDENDDQY